MQRFKTICILIILTLFVHVLPAAAGYSGSGEDMETTGSGEQSVQKNQYGAPVFDARGNRINYSKDQLQVQRIKATESRDKQAQTPQPAVLSSPNQANASKATWYYAAFGSGIGQSNILTAKNGGKTELYLGGSTTIFGPNDYWYAITYNSSTGNYDTTFVSTYFSSGIVSISLADLTGDSQKEIVVALEDGHIHIYDRSTKKWLSEIVIPLSFEEFNDFEIADLDGDGTNELIACTSYDLYVYSASGKKEWELSTTGNRRLVIGQMDNDNALEIALSKGDVIDSATKSVQWSWTNDFGWILEAADIDNDNVQELIASNGWYSVRAFDIDLQQLKWSIPTDLDIDAIYLGDIDNDSVVELLVGEGQWGNVIAFNTATQAEEWSIENPRHGFTDIVIADVDDDGSTEIIWGAGASSTGEDYLYISNWKTKQIEWQNVHLDGPFLGPVSGDLDGDGKDELVAVSYESDSGSGSGRILVFDQNGNFLAMSDEVAGGRSWTGTHGIKLHDVDNDNKMEILVPTSDIRDGVIEIYDFNADNTFTLNWTNNVRPSGSPFHSISAADIDNDGQMEIIGGVNKEYTGPEGVSIYI